MPDEPTNPTASLREVFLSWLRPLLRQLVVLLFYVAVGAVILVVIALALGMHGPSLF